MPRIKRRFEEPPRSTSGNLIQDLVDELRSDREAGQPVIHEQAFPTGKLRIVVIWDRWDRLPSEERTAVILQAYEEVEGREYRENIALASGLTFPEAYAAGMLPFQVIPAVRKSDQVTPEQCRQAMIDEGASTLLGADKPQLRFAMAEEAEAAVSRLSKRLPNSDEIWVVAQEVGKVEDWAQG
jgi:hypothetical protein